MSSKIPLRLVSFSRSQWEPTKIILFLNFEVLKGQPIWPWCLLVIFRSDDFNTCSISILMFSIVGNDPLSHLSMFCIYFCNRGLTIAWKDWYLWSQECSRALKEKTCRIWLKDMAEKLPNQSAKRPAIWWLEEKQEIPNLRRWSLSLSMIFYSFFFDLSNTTF